MSVSNVMADQVSDCVGLPRSRRTLNGDAGPSLGEFDDPFLFLIRRQW